ALDIRPARAVLRGYPEINRRLLESVRSQLPHRDVVQLHKQVRVDDGAAGHVAARIVDPPLRGLQAAVPEGGRRAVTAPRAGDPKTAAALPQVVEVEPEQIVPFDGIGIELRE